jgi:hypothetical protein
MKTATKKRRMSGAQFKNPYKVIHSVLWCAHRRTQDVETLVCTGHETDGTVCGRPADKNSGLCYKHEQERGLAP